MIRIRRICDDVHPRDRAVLAQVRDILRTQFPGLPEETVAALPDQLRDPLATRFRTILFAADDGQGTVRGFALLRRAADLRFCYLDFISAVRGGTGGDVGGALYQQVREATRAPSSRASGTARMRRVRRSRKDRRASDVPPHLPALPPVVASAPPGPHS